MEIINAFETIDKKLAQINETCGFKMVRKSGMKETEICVNDEGEKKFIKYTAPAGSYKVIFNASKNLILLDCSADNTDNAEYKTVSQTLFEAETADDKDMKSLCNELEDEIAKLYKPSEKKDISKVKLPKSVSKSAVKNGLVSYTEHDLVTRFVDQYSELKDIVKEIYAEYGEVLPETFFMEHGTPLVLDIIKSGAEDKNKKLFKLLNEIYENGTNAAQDVIAVTILGEMRNDAKMLETADKYMSDYMKTPVHEVNKIIVKKGISSKLANPPAYKPKKQKMNFLNLANGAQPPQQ